MVSYQQQKYGPARHHHHPFPPYTHSTVNHQHSQQPPYNNTDEVPPPFLPPFHFSLDEASSISLRVVPIPQPSLPTSRCSSRWTDRMPYGVSNSFKRCVTRRDDRATRVEARY